jgi:hypothetical protein
VVEDIVTHPLRREQVHHPLAQRVGQMLVLFTDKAIQLHILVTEQFDLVMLVGISIRVNHMDAQVDTYSAWA